MIVYDCEIKKIIPGGEPAPVDNIIYEHCKGWHDFPGMGISVICAYDFSTYMSHVFLEDNLASFQDLVDRTDLVVGFNSLAFDNRLCAAHGIEVPDHKSWDLQVEMWAAAGMDREFSSDDNKGFGLAACVKANLAHWYGKTMDGALAPVLWQQGKHGAVIDYCLNDVMLTSMLVDLVRLNGGLFHPQKIKNKLRLQLPDTGSKSAAGVAA